ncbi:MAG: uridine kinase [Alphaproteobacteria bacterium]|nr:uridine kinase [Alphaproteobacteria bacterium]
MTRSQFKHPLFVAGLFLRVFMLVVLLPHAAMIWYVPFMESSVASFSIDPWRVFLASGGSSLAFPYGYVMWLALLPLSALCHFAGIAPYLGYGLTLLAADVGLLVVLQRLIAIPYRTMLLVYWLSPIVLFATYWLGLNDIIPVFILCLAILSARRLRLMEAGALCGAAVSAKLSMVIAVPLFFIYLYRNRTLRHLLLPYIVGLFATLAVLGAPFVMSQDAAHMLFSNPEMGKVYDFVIHIGSGVNLYVLPMAYIMMLFVVWNIRRISSELFLVLLGVSFFLVLLLTPASPGWYVWIMPLLVFCQASIGLTGIFLVGGFSAFYAIANFLAMPRPTIVGMDMIDQSASFINNALGERGIGLLNTLLVTTGCMLLATVWHNAVRKNDYFRISRRPFVIGISGDSGSGKDTLVNSLIGLLGRCSVVSLSGDDYHFWDRQKPMWQVMTHLNPRANDLEKFSRDLLALVDGKSIQSRQYDHKEGMKTEAKKIKSNDFIIASGLHALYLPVLRDCYDLSIFLDMDEGLRRYFKMRRDVEERGHSVERAKADLDKRETDAGKFVRQQAEHADLVLSLQPAQPRSVEKEGSALPLRLKLSVRMKRGEDGESLARMLIGVCGLQVDMALGNGSSELSLSIEGDASAEDVMMAACKLMPDMMELLDTKPVWEGGMEGIMQIIILSHINQALRRRLI